MGFTENFDHFMGQIIPDPFEGIDPSTLIHIESGLFIPNDPPGIYPVYNLAHYKGALLTVLFLGKSWSSVEGSAVMVAPGIAITAAHLVEQLIEHVMAGDLNVICAGYTESGPRYWRVRHFTRANGSDLMVMSLEYASPLPSDGHFIQTRLSTRLPGVGEQIMIAGFRASDAHVAFDEHMCFPLQEGTIRYGVEIRIGVGEITEHHLYGRGSMLEGPSFEVACSTPGGLSGGPAFDMHGRLVGVLSSSLDHDDGRGPSHVSILWPAMVQPLVPFFLPTLFPSSSRLIDLDQRICDIDRRDVIRAESDPETGLIRVEVDDYT